MPYTQEILIILACVGWALWWYDLVYIEIEINGKDDK